MWRILLKYFLCFCDILFKEVVFVKMKVEIVRVNENFVDKGKFINFSWEEWKY